MELLAPAGSHEAMIAAVEAGANAVYLGGKLFGARHYASNFSLEELKEVVDYCHLRNVAVYITVNTLVFDDELEPLKAYLIGLESIQVDAIIVQDLGVAKIAREVAPRLDLHGSTQMSIHNAKGAQALKEFGFSRVVLARELSLKEIETICKQVDIEIEVFVHGALCISYSGQCLMSSMIGGRSGNRGKCAQPCRLPYQLEKNGEILDISFGSYLLSPRDLNFIEYLPELANSGVVSLKIEGRMKSPEYVGTVISEYRNALDKVISLKSAEKNLEKIFHRGYSKGYLDGPLGKEMMSSHRPNNWGEKVGRVKHKNNTVFFDFNQIIYPGDRLEAQWGINSSVVVEFKIEAPIEGEVSFNRSYSIPDGAELFRVVDTQQLEKGKSFFVNPIDRKIGLDVTVFGKANQPLTVNFKDPEGNEIIIQGEFIAQIPEKHALSKETLEKQLGRLGGTPFWLNQLEFRNDDSIMVPISELNQIRRRGIEALSIARKEQFYSLMQKNKMISTKNDFKKPGPIDTPLLQVQVRDFSQSLLALDLGVDRILFEGDFVNHFKEALKIQKLVKEKGKQFILGFPRIIPEESYRFFEEDRLEEIITQSDGVMLTGLHYLKEIKKINPQIKIYGDFSLNILNQIALKEYLSFGFDEVTLSPELNLEKLKKIGPFWGSKLQINVHGSQEVMISKFCPLGAYLGGVGNGKPCNRPCDDGLYHLVDRKGEKFPLITDDLCRSHIFNGQNLSMIYYQNDLMRLGIKVWRLDLRYIQDKEFQNIIRSYKAGSQDQKRFTKEQEKVLISPNITRGHYFRGVE